MATSVNAPLLALILWLSAAPCFAQTISGHVLEDGSARAVPGAMISLIDKQGEERYRTLADSVGRFTVSPPKAGEYYIEATRFGYVQTRSPLLALGTTGVVSLDLLLVPEPVGLEGLNVSVEDAAAEYLQTLGHTPRSLGDRWISRSEIAAMPLSQGPREVIRWQRIAGVSLDEGTGSPFDGFCLVFARRVRQCALVLVNGVPFPSREVQGIGPDDIENIAILTPIDATTLFGTQASGGAVLIWTRRGGD